MCTGGFGAAKLVVDDRTPGEESILARLSGGPAGVQADFGNPVESGGTGYSACIYASDDELVGALDVDRAGDTCGAGPCWLATGGVPGGRGFSFEDEAATSDGVRTIKLRTGAEGETSLLVRAANDASSGQTSVPSGIAARLEAATAPILQLFGSDIGCFTATIGTIKKSAPTLFRGTH